MESQLYKGSHQQLFEEFLKLVDDSDNHIAALLELVSWTKECGSNTHDRSAVLYGSF